MSHGRSLIWHEFPLWIYMTKSRYKRHIPLHSHNNNHSPRYIFIYRRRINEIVILFVDRESSAHLNLNCELGMKGRGSGRITYVRCCLHCIWFAMLGALTDCIHTYRVLLVNCSKLWSSTEITLPVSTQLTHHARQFVCEYVYVCIYASVSCHQNISHWCAFSPPTHMHRCYSHIRSILNLMQSMDRF